MVKMYVLIKDHFGTRYTIKTHNDILPRSSTNGFLDEKGTCTLPKTKTGQVNVWNGTNNIILFPSSATLDESNVRALRKL